MYRSALELRHDAIDYLLHRPDKFPRPYCQAYEKSREIYDYAIGSDFVPLQFISAPGL